MEVQKDYKDEKRERARRVEEQVYARGVRARQYNTRKGSKREVRMGEG